MLAVPEIQWKHIEVVGPSILALVEHPCELACLVGSIDHSQILPETSTTARRFVSSSRRWTRSILNDSSYRWNKVVKDTMYRVPMSSPIEFVGVMGHDQDLKVALVLL